MASANPRPRPKAMTMTDAAAQRVRDIMANAMPPVLGLRIGIKKGGCAGMEYTMDVARDPRPGDELVEDKGATVLLDAKAIMFLLGAEMDYKVTTLKSGFVFNNPNQTSACGCGESVELKPAAPVA